MDTQFMGRALIGVGLLVVVAGLIVYFGGKVGYFGLGKLPGDLRVERENFSFYFPIATSIIVSIVLTLLLTLIAKLR